MSVKIHHIVAKPRRLSARLWVSMSCIAFVAGCGGGEDGSLSFDFSSPFDAPAPVSSDVLTAFFAAALDPATTAAATALLREDKYLLQQNTWSFSGSGPAYNSFPLRSSGAAFAHAAGLSGSGSLIVITDERISEENDVFGGRVEFLINGGPNGDEHGSVVTAVAGGNSPDFIGVAPEAALAFGTYETTAGLVGAGQYAIANGAVAWNNSWEYIDTALNARGFDRIFNSSIVFNSSSDGQAYLTTLDDYAAQGVVVFAVSNEDLDHATLMSGLPYLRPSLEAGWLAAANGVPKLSASGNVTAVTLISSPCYEAARWCLVADGTWEVPDASLRLEPGENLVTGSSFAAPQVSGALALLEQAFPGLSPHELRVRLLASADDSFTGFRADGSVELAEGFDKDYSFKYGHGFIDIEAALKPIGTTSMRMADGAAVSTDAPVLVTGSAMGDALDVALEGAEVSVQDQLNGSFAMPAVALTAGAMPVARSAALLSGSLRTNLAADRKAPSWRSRIRSAGFAAIHCL
ncbi:MAG: S8 family serine peptidase [Tabrizicola sp.]|nr:S8 family serine peptidase [Tabrizicola sp.]